MIRKAMTVCSGLLILCAALPGAVRAQGFLQVNAAWNAELADGDLTYKVSGGDQATLDMMSAAIQLWADAVNAELAANGSALPFTLTQVFGRTKPNVDVKFKNGGGQVQGQALRSFDNFGFVQSVKINVSGKAFGIDNLPEVVGQIVKHEFGHALGLGHFDSDGDLMSTTVTAGALDISDCDVLGVFEANHWYFVPDDESGSPHQPHVSAVNCGGGPTPTPTPTPTPGPGSATVHVESIDPFSVGRKNELRLTYLIVDENEVPVAGAAVTTAITRPDGSTLGGTAETDADGLVTFRLRQKAKDGTYIVSVVSVTGAGITFDACVDHGGGSIDESTIFFDVVGGAVDSASKVAVDDCS